MIIKSKIKVRIKQQESQAINSLNIRTDHMTQEQKTFLAATVKKFSSLFFEPNEKLTYTTKVKGEIRTTSDSPVYTKCYPYPMSLKEEVEKEVQKLLEDGIIRPSRSPYNSPVWIVPKKWTRAVKESTEW